MRVGWYFARAVAGWFFALTVLVCGCLLLWAGLLPPMPGTPPSPWALVGPLFLVAAWITWVRARGHGELDAAAVGGTGPVARVLPVLLLGIVLQVVFAIPAGHMPATRVTRAAVQASVAGDLFLGQEDLDRGVLLARDGALRLVGVGLPDGFKPAPNNPRRYRRQAFYTRAPRFSAADPQDPWIWRLVCGLAGLLVPALLLLLARWGWVWGLGLGPLLLPLLVV